MRFLSSKCNSPMKIQMLKILVIKLLETFLNVKVKWCDSLKRTSPLVLAFKWIRRISFIYKGKWDIL